VNFYTAGEVKISSATNMLQSAFIESKYFFPFLPNVLAYYNAGAVVVNSGPKWANS
jgi:hypothetical protein